MANLVWPIITTGFLLALPAFLAWLLRRAGCPGWSVLGGLLAGLLLGPQILGALIPKPYELHVLGGFEQHQALNRLESQQGASLLAARHAGVAPADIAELQSRSAQDSTAAKRALESARWDHQLSMRVMVMVLAGIVLLGSGALNTARGNVRTAFPAAVSIGLWSATLPAVSIISAMVWWWDRTFDEALFVAAALAIGPWSLTAIDRAAADQAEINGACLVQTAGRIASMIAVALAGSSVFSLSRIDQLIGLAPLMLLPLGWAIPRSASESISRKAATTAACEFVLIPALAASVAMKADLFGDIDVWPLIVILALSDDGRWIAAFIGAMIPGGRSALRTMRLTLGSMAAGPTQLAVTAIGAHFNLIPVSLILPLMLGVALIEVTAPAKRGMAQRLAEAEEEFDQMDSE